MHTNHFQENVLLEALSAQGSAWAVGLAGAPEFVAFVVEIAKFVAAAAAEQPVLTSADVSWPEFEGSVASATYVG